MEERNLPEMRRIIGLPQKREEVTAILSECYSRDLMSLEEYENRIELVHAASTLDELERLTSDVPAEVLAGLTAGVSVPTPPGQGRELAIRQGVQRVNDQRLAVPRLDLTLTGSVVRLRYNEVRNLPRDIFINADLQGSMVRIVVPPEFEVVEELENSASIIRYRRGRRWRNYPVTGRITIRGSARSSVIGIRTRRSKVR
jgi:hypothetical protein